jgi:conjugative transfer signal peptidase TraF
VPSITDGPLVKLEDPPVKILGRLAILAAAAATGLFQLCGWFGIRINTSASLPIGFYATMHTDGGLIEFCPAEPFARLSVIRGYRDRGVCPDGAAPLLKPIAARSNDVVDFSAVGFTVNGKLLPNTAPLAVDTKGRPLMHWPFGRFIVAAGTVWVASSYHPGSFDSRYFGPIALSAIRDRVRPLLTVWE